MPTPDRLLLVTLLLKLGVMASIAAVLVRSRVFNRRLFQPSRNRRQTLGFVLFVGLPLAGGVAIRESVKSFSAADLSLPGALLIGLMAGPLGGLIGGLLIAVPAAANREWLALLMAPCAGVVGGLCRRVAPSQEEVWSFSPFIDLELWRWLRNRLDRPFRDWQALLIGVVLLLTLIHLELGRLWPALLYAQPEPGAWWDAAALVATNVLTLAIPIKIWNNTRIELKLEEQRRLLVQARLDALTSQINPHFLFNTLNSVASLVRFDPDTARLLIVKLSNILRRLLRKHDAFVALREELDFMDDYLDIEVVRFGPETLRVEQQIAPEVREWRVPSMLLQPVVENAIRHGLAPKLEGGLIVLRGRAERRGGADFLRLEVEDNGIGMEPGARPGIGLANVRERLAVLYGDRAELAIASRPGEGTRVTITFPAEPGFETVEMGAKTTAGGE